MSLRLSKIRKFLDDLRCAHGEIIASVHTRARNLLVAEDFIEARLFSQFCNMLILVFFDEDSEHIHQ